MARPSPQPRPDPAPLDPDRKELKKLKRLFERKPLTLADHHAIGEQMHRLDADEALTGYGSGWRKRVADVLGQSDSTLTKCLQFFKSYEDEPAGVAELERLGVGWVQMIIALGISDRKERHQLLRQAKEKGWGQRELRREARRLKGSYRGGGRPRKREKSRGCLADASELVRRTGQWSDFYDQAWAGNEKGYRAEVGKLTGEARGDLERVLEDAEQKLQDLQGQCEAALKDVKALRKKLTRGK